MDKIELQRLHCTEHTVCMCNLLWLGTFDVHVKCTLHHCPMHLNYSQISLIWTLQGQTKVSIL